MTLKTEKCEFIKEEIMILNYKVSYRKISPNQVKIKEVKKLKPPTDVSGIRKFTGFMNYFKRFIKNFTLNIDHEKFSFKTVTHNFICIFFIANNF